MPVPVEATNHSYSLRISYSRFSGTFYKFHTLPSLSILLLLTTPENWIHGFATPWHIARVPSLIWSWIFPFCGPSWPNSPNLNPCRGQEQGWRQKLPSQLLRRPLSTVPKDIGHSAVSLSPFSARSHLGLGLFPKTPM